MDFISIIKLTIFAAGVSASAGGCLVFSLLSQTANVKLLTEVETKIHCA